MELKDVIKTDVVKVGPNITWKEALKIMKEKNTNGVYIVGDDGKYIGMVGMYDLMKHAIPKYFIDNPDLVESEKPGTFLELCYSVVNDKIVDFADHRVMKYEEGAAFLKVAVNNIINNYYRVPIIDAEGKLIGVVNRSTLKDALAARFNF